MQAGLPGCFIRPDTTSPHLSRPSTLISLCSSQEQRGEGKIQWRNSSEVYRDTGTKYTWFTWEVILGTMGVGELGEWHREERKPTEGVNEQGWQWTPGARSCRGPSERLQNSLQIVPKKNEEVGYLSTNSHLSLFEGCSQPGHQLSSTVGCSVRNEHALVAKESPQVAILSCLVYKAKDMSVNCTEVTSKVVRQDVVGHIVCYIDNLHDYQYLHGTTCQLCNDFLHTTSFNIFINLVR